MNKFSLNLIVVDDDLEALALRSALEWWGVRVITQFVGKAQDFVDIFQKGNLSLYICIAAHGDEINDRWGFKLPELGEEIAKKQPYGKVLFADNFSDFLKLNGNHILSLGCYTGSKEIADAFLSSGAKSYIGPKKAPSGNASLYFALNFYYWLFVEGKSEKEAFDKAMMMADENIDKFLLFQK